MLEYDKITDVANITTAPTGVDSYFMMDSPWPVLSIAMAYLYFVLWLGPTMMSDRKPYNLKNVILVYNALHVAFSSWWLYKSIVVLNTLSLAQIATAACRPKELPAQVADEYDKLGYFYLLTKFVELFDTIFFVLRRKQNQVTFLHVYHHTNMSVSTWAFVKYVKPCQTFVLAWCNTFVHVIMYTYYFLAAFGPSVQKYLWWKKYLTRLQMVQFIVILAYLMAILSNSSCEKPLTFTTFAVGNTLSFLLLFCNFYIKSYRKNKTK